MAEVVEAGWPGTPASKMAQAFTALAAVAEQKSPGPGRGDERALPSQ
jgi:hypothetical protein